MRYIIHGAGAVGSLIGAMLAESGAQVLLIARDSHAATVNERGLTLRSLEGDRRITGIEAVTSPAQISPRTDDIILLTVKTGQTAASVQELRDVFDEATPIVCLQNGVRNEEWAARRFLRVYGGMAGVSATLVEPGVVAQTLDLLIAIGNYPLGCDETGLAIARDFERAGFKTTTHERIMAVKWSKLVINLNNATLAIIDTWVQLARVTPAIANFMAAVIDEGVHVLETAGIPLEDANNPFRLTTQIAKLRELTDDPERTREAREMPFDLRTYPSTWVDLKQKRGESEASYFNGEIVLLGEKHGVRTPFNSTLLQTVEEMSAELIEPGRYTLSDLEELVEQRRMKSYDRQVDSA
ncbi:MAG: ketopantoate reductase family protein [Acidobacteriota bacterium]